MKKQFKFTKESSFTHVKDKMHQGVTEHILEDDQTKELYHHVVSYGSTFQVTPEAMFMAHLLKKIGVSGVCLGYVADECKMVLPWYHPQHTLIEKAVVELPKFVKLQDVEFDTSTQAALSEKYKETFLGKTFKGKRKTDGKEYEIKGDHLIKDLFGCYAFYYGYAVEEDLSRYPLGCILYSPSFYGIGDLEKALKEVDMMPEVSDILHGFSEVDIPEEIAAFEKELEIKADKLKEDLLKRQEIVKQYISTKDEFII